MSQEFGSFFSRGRISSVEFDGTPNALVKQDMDRDTIELRR
jgi:hypothetical protein